MKQGQRFYVRRYGTTDAGVPCLLWLQEGCQGLYWGYGDHREVFNWVAQRPPRSTLASWSELALRACREDVTLYLHDADVTEGFSPPVLLTIRPNWWTRFKLRRLGFGHFLP